MQFTWYTKGRSKQLSIDYWLAYTVFGKKQMLDIKIEPSCLTDHDLIYNSINLSDIGSKPKFRYKK